MCIVNTKFHAFINLRIHHFVDVIFAQGKYYQSTRICRDIKIEMTETRARDCGSTKYNHEHGNNMTNSHHLKTLSSKERQFCFSDIAGSLT